MFILLELIFQGFFEWVYSLILECWNFFFTSLLDIMSLDFAYIKTHVPVVEDIMQVFLAVGWALLLGNLVFQAIRSMVSGLGFEGEDPKMLFARTFVFSFLLLASPQICEIGLDLTSRVMALLEIPDVIDVHLVDSGVFGTLSAAWLLVIICDIIIMFKVLKLLLEVAERYVILAVLAITAPLAFSMGGSKSTSEIFTGWCRMFGSMCLLMVTNVMFFKMLLSVVSTIPSGLDVFPWMVLIITIVKVAKKADEIITRIGLNPAITGDRGKGVGSVLAYTVLRSAASKVVKSIGAAATGGASAAAGAVAGGIGAAAGTAGTAGTAGAAGASGVAGAAFRSNTQREAMRQSSTTQEQKTESVSSGGVGDNAKGTATQTPRRDGPSRQSSVPSGVRRAASYVSGGGEGKSDIASPGGKAAGGFGNGTGRSVRTSGGSFGRGGGFSGGAGHDTLKGPGRNGAGRLRPVTVLADDFDDGGETDTRGDPIRRPPTAASAGGAGRSGSPGPAGTAPFTETSTSRAASGKRVETTIKGASAQEHQQSDSRSTRRGKAAKPPAEATAVHSGGKHIPGPAGTGDASSTQTASARKQSGSRTAQQEQRLSSSVESTVKKAGGFAARPGPAGTGTGADTGGGSRSKRRGPAPARQEAPGQTAPSGTPIKGGGSIAPPGPAGSRGGSYSGSSRRFKDRSPSPARQGRSDDTKGVIHKDGAPSIHPGTAGIGGCSTSQTPAAKERSSSPARQEQGKGSPPAGGVLKGGGPVARPGVAGTGGSSSTQTDVKSKRRGSSPARQEKGKAPTLPGQPVKGGGPTVRPGPAGTVKEQTDQTRTTKAPGALETGGPEHGKPR